MTFKNTILILKLLKEYKEFKDLFDKAKVSGFPPYRWKLDYYIRLKKDEDGKEPELL